MFYHHFQASFLIFICLVGLWHGLFNGNLVNVGRELVGTRNVVLMTGLEAFGSGAGGLCGPPAISKLTEVSS